MYVPTAVGCVRHACNNDRKSSPMQPFVELRVEQMSAAETFQCKDACRSVSCDERHRNYSLSCACAVYLAMLIALRVEATFHNYDNY